MNKKWLCGIASFTLCFVLIGCGHEHTWVEATCTEPKTCNECGETEGEPLGHTWVEATCAEPKHCSVCGETEGEALEHTLTEANYQQAATCEVCGATVGEPLQAEFEKYGLSCDAELDISYPYTTLCNDSVHTTTGKVTFSDFEIFASDDEHEALEGYEWRAVTATTIYDDENAHEYGYQTYASWVDYYEIADFADSYNDTTNTYMVNYNGIDYSDIQIYYETLQDGWNNDVNTFSIRVYCHVPIGYDGIVLAYYNAANEDNGKYINEVADENTIFFRLK